MDLVIQPELTEADVEWLNDQLALVGQPEARYARQVPQGSGRGLELRPEMARYMVWDVTATEST